MKGKLRKIVSILLGKDKPKQNVKISRFMSKNSSYSKYKIGRDDLRFSPKFMTIMIRLI